MSHSDQNVGYVYLITDGKYYKIGMTTRSVKQRLYELQIGHPNTLIVSTVISTDHPEALEKELHCRFSDKQMQGEWFNLTNDDVLEILKQGNTGEYPKEHYFWVSQEGCESLATDPEMTGSSLKVLMYLFSKLDFENFIYYSQSDIAKAISMQRSNVSRAFRFLISKGIVLQSQKVGSIKCYRLNPNYGWKGKVSNLDKHNRDHLKLVSSDQLS